MADIENAGNNEEIVEDNNELEAPIEEGNLEGSEGLDEGSQGNEESKWKPGDPFHKHPDWIKREEKVRALEEQVRALSDGTSQGGSSSNQQPTVGQIDTSTAESYFESLTSQLPDIPFPDIELDAEGRPTNNPYPDYKTLINTIDKILWQRNRMRDKAERDFLTSRDEQEKSAHEEEVVAIKRELGDDDFNLFVEFVDKSYTEDGLDLPLAALKTLWLKNIRKEVDPIKKNKESITRVNNGENKPQLASTKKNRSIRSTGWDDI